MSALDVSYRAMLKQCAKHAVKSATESRAFLVWFLENYYRLEEVEIFDCVCDGKNDKGIDGIYVNDQLRQIDIFQTALSKSDDKTQGDAKLKQFSGTLGQFRTKRDADEVLAVANPELKKVAARLRLAERIEQGFRVQGVFITNANADASARTYLATQSNIILFDGVRLKSEYIPIDKTEPISAKVSFDISDVPSLQFPIGERLNMVIAPIAGSELARMNGISSWELFAWNVRQFLGRNTNVNKAVADSIQNGAEHKYFPAFHNGVTILATKLAATDSKITISGYAVVNGCQSITSLYENRDRITSDLKMLVKFIEVPPDSDLALKITDHTNNQNGTKPRDLQSNNPVQTRLQSEIHTKYPEYRYRIKRGEHPEWPKESVIENEQLARIILAFDLERPDAWSQNYKLFDELHGELFARPSVNADRAVFLYETYNTMMPALELLEDQLFASYSLTRWLLLYLLRQAIRTDEVGKQIYENPSPFMAEKNGRQRLAHCVDVLSKVLVRLLNGAVKREQAAETYFDYKKELKSKEFVIKTATQIIPQYQIAVDGELAQSFEAMWQKSVKVIKS